MYISLYLQIYKMSNKVNAILLSLLLVIPTFGISIEKHFCGGQLADVALFTGAGCGCDEEDENDDCCREEDEIIRMSLEQFSTSVQRLPEIAQQDLFSASVTTTKLLFGQLKAESELYLHDLPPPRAVPHYKMTCSFTFYG